MTSATPFASVQHAIYYAYTNLDLNGDAGYVLTFQCAIGACASTTVSFNGPFVGQSYYPGQVLFQGSTGTPDNTTLATSSGDCVDLQNGAYVWIQGFKLTCNNSAIHVAAHSHLFYEAIDFAAVGGSHIAAVGAGSQVDIEGSYTISGAPTAAHWSAQNGAVINALVSSIITVSGTPAWGEQFASCQAATIVIDNTQLSFFGSATGQRYYTDNCFIGGSTLTATYFPGNAVGILENGGVYGDGYTIGDGVINGVRFVPGLVTTGIIQSEQITPSATNLIGQGGTSATSYSDLFDASGAASIILGGGGNSPDNTNYHKQTSHVFQDRSGTSQATINDNGVGTIGASILNTTEYFPGVLFIRAIGVNFNSIADTALSITLPKGFTRYLISSVRITNASASLTTAKFGVFPTTGGGGTAIVASGTAITVSTASDATVNNMQQTSSINGAAMSYLVANTPTIYFRVTTVQGSAATADIDLFIFCLP